MDECDLSLNLEMQACISMLIVQGERDTDGTLRIGEKTVEMWPEHLFIGDVRFCFDEEEETEVEYEGKKGRSVQASYFQN